ncbi:MAG: pantetheine-phosphate adenylyltransferase [Candidatus Diapherotrites archaeon]|nr:pantetheine-phosphate adenylyltransferase [Candidatus Diapherotrites archaeon]
MKPMEQQSKTSGKQTRFLTNELRSSLKESIGHIIEGSEKEVTEKFKKILSKTAYRKLICIGDEVSGAFDGQVKVFDGRTARNKAKNSLPFTLELENPPASITEETWNVLEKAINSGKNESVFVHGEEDLLVIPAVILADKQDIIVYGLPGRGISYLFADKNTKEKCRGIFSKMKKERFDLVTIGGTFDRLHKGHEFFLKKSSYYGKKLLVGITNNKMAGKKQFGESIEEFETRKKHVFDYLNSIKANFEIVELADFKGPSAETGDAIVVTEETLENAVKINEIRKKNNLFELTYIILPYTTDKDGQKISSTSLRSNTKTDYKHAKKLF